MRTMVPDDKGQGWLLFQSRVMTVAPGAIAERKTCGQQSYRIATRRSSLSQLNNKLTSI